MVPQTVNTYDCSYPLPEIKTLNFWQLLEMNSYTTRYIVQYITMHGLTVFGLSWCRQYPRHQRRAS